MEKAGLADRGSMEQLREQQRESFAAALDQRHADAQSSQVLNDR